MLREKHAYRNRTMCDVLSAMRKCNEVRNYASLASLIEEAQIMADKMESTFNEMRDYESVRKDHKKAVKEYNKLARKIDEAEEKIQNQNTECADGK